MYVLVGMKHCALGARAEKEKPTKWRPPGWNSELHGVPPVLLMVVSLISSDFLPGAKQKKTPANCFSLQGNTWNNSFIPPACFFLPCTKTPPTILHERPNKQEVGKNRPCCPQTTWAACYGSGLKTIRAPFVGLKSLDKVSLSVPEQSVPGGLVVRSASSRLQVTGVSSRTAVLWVRAAHSLSKHQIRLD